MKSPADLNDPPVPDFRALRARWMALVPLLPVFFLQGYFARRGALRLPEADPPCAGTCDAGAGHDQPPLRIAVLGESPVAGVGVTSHAESLAGQLGEHLARMTGRPVAWRAIGENGVTIREVRERLVSELEGFGPDVVTVALGVNDTTALTPLSRWARELDGLRADIGGRDGPFVVFNAVPPMGRFVGVPQPLRAVLGVRSGLLDRVLEARAAELPGTAYLRPRFPLERACMAEDGYHPSAYGYGLWARQLAEFLCVTFPEGEAVDALRPRRPARDAVPGSAPARCG